jgi:hypothetical protein
VRARFTYTFTNHHDDDGSSISWLAAQCSFFIRDAHVSHHHHHPTSHHTLPLPVCRHPKDEGRKPQGPSFAPESEDEEEEGGGASVGEVTKGVEQLRVESPAAGAWLVDLWCI